MKSLLILATMLLCSCFDTIVTESPQSSSNQVSSSSSNLYSSSVGTSSIGNSSSSSSFNGVAYVKFPKQIMNPVTNDTTEVYADGTFQISFQFENWTTSGLEQAIGDTSIVVDSFDLKLYTKGFVDSIAPITITYDNVKGHILPEYYNSFTSISRDVKASDIFKIKGRLNKKCKISNYAITIYFRNASNYATYANLPANQKISYTYDWRTETTHNTYFTLKVPLDSGYTGLY